MCIILYRHKDLEIVCVVIIHAYQSLIWGQAFAQAYTVAAEPFTWFCPCKIFRIKLLPLPPPPPPPQKKYETNLTKIWHVK